MSIRSDQKEYVAALEKAHKDFPLESCYPYSPHLCNHIFDFVVFCDGGNWDIVRCQKCGSESVRPCTFDDDYD